MAHICVVDDKEILRESLLAALAREDAIGQFNAKPYEERRRLFDEYAAWEEERETYIDAMRSQKNALLTIETGKMVENIAMEVAPPGPPPLPKHQSRNEAACLLY